MTFNPLTALSPLDGRYASKTDKLRPILSEAGFMHHRVKVEIAWLQALRCRVVVMSATLPASRRDALLRAWAGTDTTPARAMPSDVVYPRLSWATPGAVQASSFAASRPQRVAVHPAPAEISAPTRSTSAKKSR